MNLSVRIEGGQRVSAIINQLAAVAGADGRRGLLSVLGDTVIAQTQLRFIDQTAPDGTPWKPSVRAREQGGQTLLDKGTLRNSVSKQVTGDAVEIGTNVLYANAMQFGLDLTAAPGKAFVFKLAGRQVFTRHIAFPGRPFIGLSSDNEEELEDTAGLYIANLIGKEG